MRTRWFIVLGVVLIVLGVLEFVATAAAWGGGEYADTSQALSGGLIAFGLLAFAFPVMRRIANRGQSPT